MVQVERVVAEEGDDVRLDCEAVGMEPLTYEWRSWKHRLSQNNTAILRYTSSVEAIIVFDIPNALAPTPMFKNSLLYLGALVLLLWVKKLGEIMINNIPSKVLIL